MLCNKLELLKKKFWNFRKEFFFFDCDEFFRFWWKKQSGFLNHEMLLKFATFMDENPLQNTFLRITFLTQQFFQSITVDFHILT